MPEENRPNARILDTEEQGDEQVAQSVPGGQLKGFCRDGTLGERSEKDADFDEDGTRLMPELKSIHKIGHLKPRKEKTSEFSNMDIEDLDSGYQSFFNQPLTQRKTESDVASQNPGEGSGTATDIPVEDAGDSEQPKSKVGHLLKRAYALRGSLEFQGLPIAVENKAGDVRSGVDKDGSKWHTEMKFPYGYIKGTEGADGDGVDVYVGPDKGADFAYVVHQKDPQTGKYDEDKIMLGFGSKKEAKEAFMDHYDDPEGFLGPISEVSMDRLRQLVESKGRLVKISQVTYAAMLSELAKLAADELGPIESTGTPQPAPFQSFVGDLRNTRKTVNLARKLWEARSTIPMLI